MQQQFKRLKQAYKNNIFPDLKMRTQWLNQLKAMILENEEAIIAAINSDFSERSSFEAKIAEIYPSIKAIKYTKKNMARWMRPEKRHMSLWFKPASARVMYQPLGIAGIIVPWNYPLYMAMGPMVAAIGAGNRVMLKMSEFTPKFGQLFKELIGKYLPSDVASVVTGGADAGAEFSSLPFDHILFTGSTQVGKKVMQAASNNLTPVTLELGGKSPSIIDKDFPVRAAAERIMFGKLINSGQTCLAPDYVFVHKDKQQEFVDACKKVSLKFHPEWDNPHFSSINSPKQFERQQKMLKDAKEKGAEIVYLNNHTENKTSGRKISPAIILQSSQEMLIRQEEIFGPNLPVITYEKIDEAIEYVNNNEHPLALYFFSYNRKNRQRILMETISGGVTLNDTVLHISQEDLPFGGVGKSGMGHYHGFDGFKTFSKAKSIFKQSRFAGTRLMYPPYGKRAKLLYKLMRGK